MTPPHSPPRTFPQALASALRGIRHAARTQRHFRAHLILAAVIFLTAAWVGLSVVEFAVVAVTVGLVLAAELLNTSVEMLTDQLHPHAGSVAAAVKDVSAAAVLTTAVLAAAVGALVFLPHLMSPIPAVTRGLPVILALVCLAALLAGASRVGRLAG